MFTERIALVYTFLKKVRLLFLYLFLSKIFRAKEIGLSLNHTIAS